jgi:phosphoglycerate dehydrogenase-like enzyme
MPEHLIINFPLEQHLVDAIRSWGIFDTVEHFPSTFTLQSTHPQHFWNYEPANIPEEAWQKATALMTMVWIPESMQQAPNLRLIQAMSAGLEHMFERGTYLQSQEVQEKVKLCSAAGVHSSSIAEHAIMHILAHFHKLSVLTQIQQERYWHRTAYVPPGSLNGSREVRGHTIGVVGYGCIGREVARIATALGMRVLAASSNGEKAPARGYTIDGTGDSEGALPMAWFPSGNETAMRDFWSIADVVVLACPLTSATRHLVNADTLKQMKKTAFLVNIARGAVIDQPALIHALETEQIAGAMVDVTDPEPLPQDHPLWTTKNCVITPHITGATAMYETRCVDLLKENMARLKAGKSLINEFDLSRA